MDKHTEKAIQGAALMPLSREQKKSLVLLARRAYAKSGSKATFDEWRHSQQLQCVERASLCICTNEDYLFLKGHYLRLLGSNQEAAKIAVKAACEPRYWAKAKLEQECEAAKDVMPGALNYASGFLKNCRHIDIDSASEKQLWHAIYVVRRRAAQLRRSATALWRQRQNNRQTELGGI